MRWNTFRHRQAGGSKYGNVPKRCLEGLFHHSTKESKRCNELHALQRGGLIRDLKAHPQPRYELAVNGVHICAYLPDFEYVDCDSGDVMIEDVKGLRTREYILKARLMLAVHGIEIRET